MMQKNLALQSNSIYPVSFWAKASNASPVSPQKVSMKLQEFGGPYTVYCQRDIYVTSSSWQLYHTPSCIVYTVASGYSTNLYLNFDSDSGTVWVDNIIIGSAASPYP